MFDRSMINILILILLISTINLTNHLLCITASPLIMLSSTQTNFTSLKNPFSPVEHLILYFHNFSSLYSCEFDQLHYCGYKQTGSLNSWTFQQSLTEFAVRMRQLAEAADHALQNFGNNHHTTSTSDATITNTDPYKLSIGPKPPKSIIEQDNLHKPYTDQLFPFVLPRFPNYFPCTAQSIYNNNGEINDLSKFQLTVNIYWPDYFFQPTPIVPEDITDTATTINNGVSDHEIGNNINKNVSKRKHEVDEKSELQKGSRWISHRSDNDITDKAASSNLIACLKFKLRFSNSTSDSQLNLSLGSIKQTIRSSIDMTSYRDSSIQKHTTNLYWDWSVFKSEKSANQLPLRLPLQSWFNVSIPIPDTDVILKQSWPLDSNYNKIRQRTLILQTTNWIAIENVKQFQLVATRGVCIDDIHFETSDNGIARSECARQISWFNQTTGSSNVIAINHLGMPLIKFPSHNDNNDVRPGGSTQSSLLLLSIGGDRSPNLDTYGFWLSGSIGLGLFITSLLFLFILTVGLSIICGQPKFHRSKTNRLAMATKYGRFRPSNDSLTSQLQVYKDNVGTEINNTDDGANVIDTNPHLYGIERNLSNQLHTGSNVESHNPLLNETSISLSTYVDDEQNEPDKWNVNTSTTTAIQLLRNWYFYKRRSKLQRAAVAAAQQKGKTKVQCIHPAFMKTTGADNSDTLTTVVRTRMTPKRTNADVRQSLVLSINSENELVLVPTAGQSDHTDNEATTVDNNVSSYLNSLSEEDAEATRLEMAVSVDALGRVTPPSDVRNDTLPTLPRSLIESEAPPSYQDYLSDVAHLT